MSEIQRLTVHEQIAAILRAEVQTEFGAGDRFPSQTELANRFGTSQNTVREAIGVLVQEGLLERRKGSGTFVSDPRLSRAVGVLIELDIFHPATSFFFQRVVQLVRGFFQTRGYATRLYVGHTPPGGPQPERPTCEELVEDLERHRLLGLAVVGTGTRTAWAEEICARGVPVVDDKAASSPNTAAGHQELVEAGTRYLVRQGRRNLAFLDWGDPAGSGHSGQRFARVLAELELPFRREWCLVRAQENLLHNGWQAFQELWAREERPDGIIVADDMLFYSMLPAVLQQGVAVPEELLVVTHTTKGDPRPIHVPVARLEVDPVAFADSIGEALLRRMAGQSPAGVQRRREWRLVPLSAEAMPAGGPPGGSGAGAPEA
jgi:DNA-binding LacI/PurR family transcriptional regulator